jgi:hypothetical protein
MGEESLIEIEKIREGEMALRPDLEDQPEQLRHARRHHRRMAEHPAAG